MMRFVMLAGCGGLLSSFLQHAALALGLDRLGGGAFQLAALAPGLDAFGGGLFAVALRMSAELMPIGLGKIDVIMFRGFLDILERQSAIGVGRIDDLVEP